MIEKIQTIVTWYAGIPRDFHDVSQLMSARRSLSCYLADVAAQTAELYSQKSGLEFIRKAKHADELRQAMENGKTSAAAAKIIADNAVEHELRQEQQADAEYKRAAMLYDAWRNICDVMSQHISNLKAEMKNEFTGQGSQR